MFSVQRRLQAIIMKLLLWLVSTDKLPRDKTFLRPLRLTARGLMDTGVKGENKLKKSVFLFSRRCSVIDHWTSVCTQVDVFPWESEPREWDGECRYWLSNSRTSMALFAAATQEVLLFSVWLRDPPIAVSTCSKRTFWVWCITATRDSEESPHCFVRFRLCCSTDPKPAALH